MGSAITDRSRTKLLDCAYSLGVTHFDTAPLYGMGEAESLLGKFIQDKRDKLTIATKFGFNPPRLNRQQRLVLPLARYLNRRFPGLRRFISSRRASRQIEPVKADSAVILPSTNSSVYKVEEIQKSLHSSLLKLRTDYIDIYLLHECKVENLDETVINKLEEFVKAGKILAYGLATNESEASKILTQYPSFKGCVQVGYKITDNDFENIDLPNNLLTIFHSVLSSSSSELSDYLSSDNEAMKRWSNELDYDLNHENAIAKFLLCLAVEQNKDGITLFSSSKVKNIQANLGTRQIDADQINVFKKLVNADHPF